MKPIVIYHAQCADGFGAAFAAWLKLGDEAEYLPMQYGEAAEGQLGSEFGVFRLVTKTQVVEIQNREVCVLDFSLPRELTEKLLCSAKRVVWLDHHKSALEMWCGKYEKGMRHEEGGINVISGCDVDITLDDNKSGAMLAWEHFHPGVEVPMFIRHIDDYDRWQFKLEGTKEFNKALWSYAPWSFDQWHNILDLTDSAVLPDMYLEGQAILRAHEQYVQSVVKGGARECVILKPTPPIFSEDVEAYAAPWVYNRDPSSWSIAEVRGLAANCPTHLVSDVGHELAKKSGTFGLCWSIFSDGTCGCSLRSEGDYDVSIIAKAFGGGGHKNAAGFSVDIQTLLEWIK